MLVHPTGAQVATLRKIMGTLPQQAAGLGQIRDRDLIALLVVVQPAAKEAFNYSSSFHVGHDAEQIDVWIKPDPPAVSILLFKDDLRS